jgi:large subunit ribosomal protein L1
MSKRTKAFKELLSAGKLFSLDQAIAKVQEIAKGKLTGTKFDQTISVAINLGVDPRKSDQVVRGATVLPNGTGRSVRVAVFAQGDKAEDAKAAGADIVGFEDLAELVKKGEMNFDVVIATPDAMRIVGTIGQILGPKGLMPNPKVGTVTPDVATAVKNAKAGQVRYRTDKAGIIHAPIGKVSFEAAHLKQNLLALLSDLHKIKPSSAKGVYMKKISIASTMGPGCTIEQSTIEA